MSAPPTGRPEEFGVSKHAAAVRGSVGRYCSRTPLRRISKGARARQGSIRFTCINSGTRSRGWWPVRAGRSGRPEAALMRRPSLDHTGVCAAGRGEAR